MSQTASELQYALNKQNLDYPIPEVKILGTILRPAPIVTLTDRTDDFTDRIGS